MCTKAFDDTGSYRCVVCGSQAPALTRSYGPTVLKLATCEHCGNVVDKYIEYDPVIVMLDLILITREAQRHVLYNTQFYTFKKLFVILVLLETYAVWCKNNIMNLIVETLCLNQFTSLTIAAICPYTELLESGCPNWQQDVKVDEADPFISEKAFYIAFASVFTGTVAFALSIHALARLGRIFSSGSVVSMSSSLKTITLGNMSHVFTLPLLIWGIADTQTKNIHIVLVFAYMFLVFVNALAVMHNFNIYIASGILLLAYLIKFVTVYISKCYIESIV